MGTFFATTCLFNIRPIGWQGITAPALTVFACGGSSTGGTGGAAENRLNINPSLGNGWDTLYSPTGNVTGSRFPPPSW